MFSLPRLEFDQLEPALAARLEPRMERLGYLGEFFKCAGHQPNALKAFMDFTENSKEALPATLVETVALSAAGWMGNDYERNQHERLSVRLGFGYGWIEAVNRLEPDECLLLTKEERLVQKLALTVLNTKGKGAGDIFEAAVKTLGAGQAVAVLMVLGRYVVHGLFVNTLALQPPVPSIFEGRFAG